MAHPADKEPAAAEHFRALRVYPQAGSACMEQLPVSALSAGEVLVRVAWSSLNYKDALAVTGRGKIVRGFPRVPGIDLAGTVLSSGRAEFPPGSRVLATGCSLGERHDGGFAERARLPADWVLPVPEGMSMRQSMIIGSAGLTVALCVHRLECNGQRPEQGPVLVTGASGGVGSLAVAVLAQLGYEVHALSAKATAGDYLRSLGAAQVLNRFSLQWGQRALESARWAAAIDTVGAAVLSGLTRVIQPWGNIVSVGLAGGHELHTTVMPFILRGVNLLGVTAASCPDALRRRMWQRLGTDLAPPHLQQINRQTISLEEVPEFSDKLLEGTSLMGRTLLRIDPKADAME